MSDPTTTEYKGRPTSATDITAMYGSTTVAEHKGRPDTKQPAGPTRFHNVLMDVMDDYFEQVEEVSIILVKLGFDTTVRHLDKGTWGTPLLLNLILEYACMVPRFEFCVCQQVYSDDITDAIDEALVPS